MLAPGAVVALLRPGDHVETNVERPAAVSKKDPVDPDPAVYAQALTPARRVFASDSGPQVNVCADPIAIIHTVGRGIVFENFDQPRRDETDFVTGRDAIDRLIGRVRSKMRSVRGRR
jgi:hypothetical protein